MIKCICRLSDSNSMAWTKGVVDTCLWRIWNRYFLRLLSVYVPYMLLINISPKQTNRIFFKIYLKGRTHFSISENISNYMLNQSSNSVYLQGCYWLAGNVFCLIVEGFRLHTIAQKICYHIRKCKKKRKEKLSCSSVYLFSSEMKCF